MMGGEKVVVDALTKWHSFTTSNAWENSGEILLIEEARQCDNHAKWIGYLLMHEPTEATFVGISNNPAECFARWHGRLLDVDRGAKNLNVAFRAVFTKREDFKFKLVAFFNETTIAHRWQETMAANIIDQFGRNKCLNVDNRSIETKGFWKRQVPADQWAWRFGSMDKGWRKRTEAKATTARELADEQAEANDYLRSLIPKREGARVDPQQGVRREETREEIEENTRRLLAAFPNAGPDWAKPIASSDPVVFVAPAKVIPPWPEMPRYTQGTKFTSYAGEMKRWRDAVLHVALQRGMPEASWPVVSFMPATTCKELSDLGAGLLDQVKAVCPQEEP